MSTTGKKKISNLVEDSIELSMDGDTRQVYINCIADIEYGDGRVVNNANIHIDFTGDVLLVW